MTGLRRLALATALVFAGAACTAQPSSLDCDDLHAAIAAHDDVDYNHGRWHIPAGSFPSLEEDSCWM